MDPELTALCLFFAHSPVEHHRAWVDQQFRMHPELNENAVLMRLLRESLWDSSGTDHANGIGALLNLLGICISKLESETAEFDTSK